MNKIDVMKGIGSFYHSISAVYDKLYANPSRFVCFILITKDETIRRTFQLGKYLEYLEKLVKFVKGMKWFQSNNQCTSYS